MHINLSTKIGKFFLRFLLIVLILCSAGSGSSIARAQDAGIPQPGTYDTADRVTPDDLNVLSLSDGTPIEKHIINGPSVSPPGFEAERQAVALSTSDGTMVNGLAEVPGTVWVFGCSATAAGEIAAFYDNHGYSNIYTGPTNGGVMPVGSNPWPTFTDYYYCSAAANSNDPSLASALEVGNVNGIYTSNPLVASMQGVDGRTTFGSIDDYWMEYNNSDADPYTGSDRGVCPAALPVEGDISSQSVGWPQHTWGDAIGDYMYTSQSAFGNVDGATAFYNDPSGDPFTCDAMSNNSLPDGTLGRKLFYQARGYAVGTCYNQLTDNVIAGGFSFAQFKAEIDAGRPVMLGLENHSVVGIGYDNASNKIYLHDGWDYATHEMTWGGSYAGMALQDVSIVNIVSGTPNFYTISGNVGVAGATITYTGGSTISDSSGNYSFSVSENWFGTVTPFKTGSTFRPSSRSYANVVANKTLQDFNTLNLLIDPGFEAYTPNPYWVEASTNFETPLCTIADCGTAGGDAGPRTGSVWGWFGGTTLNETSSLSQTVTIPSGTATLKFYFWIGGADSGSDAADKFIARIDGTPVFTANATQTGLYPAYTLVSVDVSAYANGGSHVVTFLSETSGQTVHFNLDDVSLTGTFTISGNAGIVDATLSYVDGTPKMVTANASGNYSINVPFFWSGTLTPSKVGYNFSPSFREYVELSGNQTAQNYTLAPITYTIYGNAGTDGATLTYTGGSTTTDSNGNYSFPISYGWTGTVTPSKDGYVFTPVSKSYTNMTENKAGENYTTIFDNTPPIVSSITRSNNNPTSAINVIFLVTFSETVTGVETNDFTLTTTGVTGASISGISGSGATRTVTVKTGSGDGTIRLNLIDDNTIVDWVSKPLGGAGAGNGNFSSGEVYTVDKPDLSAPTLRSPRNGIVTSDQMPTFWWTNVKGGSTYQVEFAANNSFIPSLGSYVVGGSSYTVSTPLVDGTYFWHVRAYNASNQPGAWSAARTFTIDTTGPSAPILNSPADNANTRTPTFRWDSVPGAVLYEFQYDNASDFSSPYKVTTRSTFRRPPAMGLGAYDWRVRAKDAAGNWGDWSTTRTVNITRP